MILAIVFKLAAAADIDLQLRCLGKSLLMLAVPYFVKTSSFAPPIAWIGRRVDTSYYGDLRGSADLCSCFLWQCLCSLVEEDLL